MFKIEIPEFHRQKPVIQLIPLVDILFYTLIFLMTIAVLERMETELSISVPKASEGKSSARAPGEIVINVDRGGRMIVNQKTVGQDELEKILKRIAGLYPNQPVIIRADAKTHHESVIRVLDACAASGIWNIAFSTIKEQKT